MNKTHFKPFSAKKTMLVILGVIFFILLLLGNVSALTIDDVKYYDEETSTYTLENFFGLGKHIADLELKTPQMFKVPRGYQRVAEIEIRNGEYDYEEIINGIELDNIKDNMKEVIRNVDYKYKTIIQVPNYDWVCSKELNVNGTLMEVCKDVENGTREEEVWRDFTKNSLLRGEIITLGLFTDVQKGDKVEWILNVYGNERLTKWAGWTESLNVGLMVYYPFDETSGSIAVDVRGLQNGTIQVGVTLGVEGIKGTAFNFTGASSGVVIDGLTSTTTNYTFSFWAKPNVWVSANKIIFDAQIGRLFLALPYSTGQISFYDGTARSFGVGLPEPLVLKHYVFVLDGGSNNGTLYVNSVIQATQPTYIDMNIGGQVSIGSLYSEGDEFVGVLDEFRIWNRTLNQLEVTEVYDFDIFEDELPIVTLNSPIDNYNSTSSSITFNATAYDSTNLANVTLIIDGIDNETNSSGINNSYYIFTKTLSEGNHNWTMRATNNESLSTTATVRNFSVDVNNPTVIILAPPTTINYHLINTNLSVNWSANDTNIDTCTLQFEGVNRTLTCVDNSTEINITTILNKTITIYVNDTFGHMNSTSRSWDYTLFQNSLTFNSETIGGSTEDFTLNITKDSSLQISIVNLVYNLSASSASFTSGDTPIISKSLDIPNPSEDINFSFYFSFTMSDAQIINTSSNNQTILNFAIGNCSTFTTLIYNFTLLDEENQTQLFNVTIDYAFNLFDNSGITKITNFSESSTVNPTAICINQNLTTSSFSLDAVLKYISTDATYLTRYYNILNFSLTNSSIPNNINIYDVTEDTGTPFQLTFRDSSLIFFPNILVNVDKQYVDSDDFKTVEIPITDSNGQTILNLVRNIAIYNLIFINSNRNIVASFNNINAFCQDFTIGECTLNLDATTTATQTFNPSESIGISYVLEYVNSTNIATLTFSSLNSTAVTIRILGTSQNQFRNQTVCDSSLTSTLGTVTCNASSILITDNYLFIDIFSNGNYVATRIININPLNPLVGGLYGSNGYFLAFFLLLLIIILFSDDKQVLLIMLGIGWVTILVLGLIKGTMIGSISGGIWLLVSIITMIWKLKQEEVGR